MMRLADLRGLAMAGELNERIDSQLLRLKEKGLYHRAPILRGPQGPRVTIDSREILMLSSNDYLGLANHPNVVAAARDALERYGNGTASVRYISGTTDLHKRLEAALADFLETESALVFLSANDAHQALIPALFTENDAVFSDELNHASIIDALRLSKARRYIYCHADIRALEKALREEAAASVRLIITDGLFSMEGHAARLPEICDLANKHACLVAVNDAHALGVLGKDGRGTPEHFGLSVDILTGNLGNVLGGACGGFVAASCELIDLLTQKARPYLFSSALPPSVAAGALAALDLLRSQPSLREKLSSNTRYFREGLSSLGLDVVTGDAPIIPIMVKDASLARTMADMLFEEGVFVCAFAYPVVPKGAARLRAQVSAVHTTEHLDFALETFGEIAKKVGIL